MFPMSQVKIILTTGLAILMLQGCSGSSVFKPYPQQITPAIVALGQTPEVFEQEVAKLEEKATKGKSGNKILFNLEEGRLHQIKGEHEKSLTCYKRAISEIQEREQKALVSASKTAAVGASLITNDNSIPYEGHGFEKVMLYQLQSQNYLAMGDLSKAMVEVRRANEEQMFSLERHQKALEKAERDRQKRLQNKKDETDNYQTKLGKSLDGSGFSQMDDKTNGIKNSFQNAYTWYFSGLLREATGDDDDAYIDYKKALELSPDNRYLQADVYHLARRLKRTNDVKMLSQKYQGLRVKPGDVDRGELIVLFENDLIAQRREIMIPFPAGKGNLGSIAFPIYKLDESQFNPLAVSNGKHLGKAEPLCRLELLAAKSLSEKRAQMITRQVLRVFAKQTVARESEKRLGLLGKLAANAYNVSSERADLRNWLSLPNEIQMLRLPLTAGVHQLTLEHPDFDQPQEIEVEVVEGKKTIAWVTRVGDLLFTDFKTI